VFVRQDIPIQHQIIQSCHAVLTLSEDIRIAGTPNIVLIGVSGEEPLQKVKAKLAEYGFYYSAWTEPDYDLGFTAIAVEPLDSLERAPLRHYRLWKAAHISRGSSEKEQPAGQTASREVGGSIPSPGTTLSASSLVV